MLAVPGADPMDSMDPTQPARVLRVVYFDPAGRESAPGYRERLDRALTEIQAWYRDEMVRNGQGPLTFPLERDERGRLVVHRVRSSRSYAPGEEIGSGEIRDEQVVPALLREGIDAEREHLLIFANTVFCSDEERGKVVRSSSVYGGLGDHRSGTAWVTDCELLDPRQLAQKQPIVWDDGVRRYTLGGYNVVYLGGVAHELGHAFGLPHDVETEAQRAELGYALMGSGNYHLFGKRAGDAQEAFLSRAEATMLAHHPLFRREGSAAADGAEAAAGAGAEGTSAATDAAAAGESEVGWHELVFESGRGEYIVRGRVEARPRAYAVVAFHDDLAIEADYDATAWVGQVDGEGRFELRVGAPVPGRYELRLRCCLVDGAEETTAYHLEVDQELALAGQVERVE